MPSLSEASDAPRSRSEWLRLRREARALRRATVGTHVDPDVTNRLSNVLIFELFSGSGRLAKACCRLGFSARTFDIDQGVDQDILDDAAFASICDLIKRHQISFLWLGIPCCTWSRARRPGGGPPPLRSDEFIMGYPDLRGKNRIKVRLHNRIMYRCAELVNLCQACSIDCAIENPASSRLWLAKPMTKIIRTAYVLQLDFCQYAERWRKRTQIVTSCASLMALSKLCGSSGAHPLCSRTGRRHIQLSGIDKNSGLFRTMLACPYPKMLVRRTAQLLRNYFNELQGPAHPAQRTT